MQQSSEIAKLDSPDEKQPLLSSPAAGPSAAQEKEGTKLYLAYGSNLAASTFLERRNIKPLRAINVLAPDLQLVFDLPGIPYIEPCFANTRVRARPDGSSPLHRSRLLLSDPAASAALGWHKGLVGVAYEVTDSDFAHIIATEGGGSAYLDVVVDAFVLPPGTDVVPDKAEGDRLRVHTLLAKPSEKKGFRRRDGWAEPSARYLGLLTTGAAENGLPREYREWLGRLRPYTLTTVRQKAGRAVIVGTWLPVGFFLIQLQSALVDKRGRAPAWLARITEGFFALLWGTYDRVYRRLFGEGERTVGDRFGT